ncbi:Non-histone chromosomal protein 6 [Podochytrium sp. JEL0797]|nr:Non-histone chromosomal protein 6 [Podochytrium sp. JEL0797]
MPKEPKEPKAKAAKRAPKAKKDPLAPKKAVSAYLLFSNANRTRIKEENPSATFGDLGKLLGAEWKTISDEEKQKYVLLQEKDKKRYAEAMKSYTPGAAPKAAVVSAEDVDEEEEDDD